jgi:hypothetical protein
MRFYEGELGQVAKFVTAQRRAPKRIKCQSIAKYSASKKRVTSKKLRSRRSFLSWQLAVDGKRFVVRADEKLTAFVEVGGNYNFA